MSLPRWKQLSRKAVFENRWWKYWKDEFELPSGKTGEYHFVHTNGASMIVPVSHDGKLILVNQYRYLNAKESLEFPCGGVKDGSNYDDTATAELAEETGFAARDWMIAGEFNPYNGVTDEIARVYIAKELFPMAVKQDETEEFENVLLTGEEIEARIVSGVIWDGMTIAAWGIAKNYL
jgi:ADP-ribose pyrophosphatase